MRWDIISLMHEGKWRPQEDFAMEDTAHNYWAFQIYLNKNAELLATEYNPVSDFLALDASGHMIERELFLYEGCLLENRYFLGDNMIKHELLLAGPEGVAGTVATELEDQILRLSDSPNTKHYLRNAPITIDVSQPDIRKCKSIGEFFAVAVPHNI